MPIRPIPILLPSLFGRFCAMVCFLHPVMIYAGDPSADGTKPDAPANAIPPAQAVYFAHLKASATALFDHLEAHFPGGAGPSVTTLVKSWYELNADGTFRLDAEEKRIPKKSDLDSKPVHFGQLKRVAKPFYDRLASRYYVRGYPWQGNPDLDLRDAARITTEQAQQVFKIDLVKDSDGNQWPDFYEQTHGFNYSVGDGAEALQADFDGDGISNEEEFKAGTDPHIPPDGQLVATKQNDRQHVYEDSYLSQPLILKITGGKGKPIPHVPVTFRVQLGKLADWRTTPYTDLHQTYVQVTDDIGEVAAQYHAPLLLKKPVTITASFEYRGIRHEHTFMTIFDPGDPDAPNAPEDFNTELAGPYSIKFTWTDKSDNEDGFTLSFQRGDDQPWEEIVTLPANTTSYVLESPPIGSNIMYMIQSFKN